MAEHEVIGKLNGGDITRIVQSDGVAIKYAATHPDEQFMTCGVFLERKIYDAIRNGPPLPKEIKTYNRWVANGTSYIERRTDNSAAIFKEHWLVFRTSSECERGRSSQEPTVKAFTLKAHSEEEADRIAVEAFCEAKRAELFGTKTETQKASDSRPDGQTMRAFKRWVTVGECEHGPDRPGDYREDEVTWNCFRSHTDSVLRMGGHENFVLSGYEIMATSDDEADRLAIMKAKMQWAHILIGS